MGVVRAERFGLYHISSGESLSMFDIVCNIAKYCNLDISLINSVKSKELNQIAKRPVDSSLIIEKAKKDFNFNPMKLNNVLKELL